MQVHAAPCWKQATGFYDEFRNGVAESRPDRIKYHEHGTSTDTATVTEHHDKYEFSSKT